MFNLPKNITKNLVIFFSITFLFIVLLPLKINAAEVYINPATGTVENQTFSTTVTVDPLPTEQIETVDIYIKYDPLVLNVNSINQGDFNLYNNLDNNSNEGVIHINASGLSGNQDVVELSAISFENLTTSGFIDIEILESPPYNSSILASDGSDILSGTTTASLLVDIQETETTPITTETQESTQATVPDTGYNNLGFYLLMSLLLILVSFYINKNAIT